MTRADLVVRGATVVTVDPERRVLSPGTVVVAEDRVVAVDADADLTGTQAIRTIDARGKVVIPGLVNAHSHNLHILMRGGPSDFTLHLGVLDWTLNALDPSMRAHSRADVRLAAQLYCLEAIRSGITTTAENMDYSSQEVVFDEAMAVYLESGLRMVVGDVFCDLIPPAWDAHWDAAARRWPGVAHARPPFPLQETGAALDRIAARMKRHRNGADGRVLVCPAPIDPCVNTAEGLLAARDLAREHATPLLVHAAVGGGFDDLPGMSNVEYLDSIGFLGPEILASHMIEVDAADIGLLRRHGVGIGYCPSSMMLSGSATAPVVDYLNAGLDVGVGTDDPNANQCVNLFSEMKAVALAQSQRYGANALPAERALEMATIGGAAALGMAAEIGSIEPGKKADLVVMDLRRAHTVPVHSVASALVYQANGSEVETVVVDGRVLLDGGHLAALSPEAELEFLDAAQRASTELLERAGMRDLRDRGWVPAR